MLLFDAPLSGLTKMAINIVLTSAACLFSYQLLVRRTPIGTLLNGRRIPRGAASAALHRTA